MSSRGHLPPGYGSRQVRHGTFPVAQWKAEQFPENLETEIERLAGDNRQLASTDKALRRDLVAAEQDIERLRAHIGSIQTESDIQIRVLMEKIGRMEAEIRRGEILRKELEISHVEAKGLVDDLRGITAKIEEANSDLERTLNDVPEELGVLRKEHQNLRTTFEYEKSINEEKVKEMKVLDEDLLAMSRDIDRLRSDISNTKNRARAPAKTGNGPYMNSDHTAHDWGGSFDN